MKKGRFEIHEDLYRQYNLPKLRKLFDWMRYIPIQVDSPKRDNIFRHFGYSTRFRSVKDDQIAPMYRINIETNDDGTYKFSVHEQV